MTPNWQRRSQWDSICQVPTTVRLIPADPFHTYTPVHVIRKGFSFSCKVLAALSGLSSRKLSWHSVHSPEHNHKPAATGRQMAVAERRRQVLRDRSTRQPAAAANHQRRQWPGSICITDCRAAVPQTDRQCGDSRRFSVPCQSVMVAAWHSQRPDVQPGTEWSNNGCSTLTARRVYTTTIVVSHTDTAGTQCKSPAQCTPRWTNCNRAPTNGQCTNFI